MAARTCSSGCAQEENSPSRSATYPSSETIIEYSSLPMALLRVRPAHSLCAGTAADQPVTTDADQHSRLLRPARGDLRATHCLRCSPCGELRGIRSKEPAMRKAVPPVSITTLLLIIIILILVL